MFFIFFLFFFFILFVFFFFFFFFQAEDGIRDRTVTGVQTCALPISATDRLKVSRYYRSSFGAFGPGGISPVVKTLIIISSTAFLLQIFDSIAGDRKSVV